MASVIVTWTGRCPEAQARSRLLGHLQRLAEVSDGYLRATAPERPLVSNAINEHRGKGGRPRANIESIDQQVGGSILISSEIASDRGAFIDTVRDAGLPIIAHPQGEGACLTRIDDARLRGVDFKLFDPRGLYPGADRLSFVFLECAGLPFLDGRLVQVHDSEDCKTHDLEIVRGASYCLATPSIHLRYYLEDWLDLLFVWLKFFFIGDLWWRRHEEMQGYAEYRGILLDLQNSLGPEPAEGASFEALLATFGSHADELVAQLAGWARDEQGAK